MTENAGKLLNLLFTKQFDVSKLISELESGAYSIEDVNTAAYLYVDNCINLVDEEDCEAFALGETISNIESSHLLEAIRILLDYGLDPEMLIDEPGYPDNIMYNLYFVHNGYQTADAAVLMLERTGNPNLFVKDESLVDNLGFDFVWFLYGDCESRFIADTFMHYFMVFLGFGLKWEDGSEMVKTYGNFKISDFINHRKYYYGIVHNEEKNTTWVSFFDKDTNREVARYT